MKRVVLKYGGSSVATSKQILAIANHIKTLYDSGIQVIVVVSAMGKTTNLLISLANEITTSPNRRELDAIMSTGETVSIGMMSLALQSVGVKAVSLTGLQAGIKTTNKHTKAFITEVKADRIIENLNKGYVVVVAGFQGANKRGDITTLGRGGSDTTAVAIASELRCPCEIYTDVDAVHTIDPRIYPSSRSIHQITYDEMMEMAVNGAKVLDARCVEIAKKFNVPLFTGKTLENDKTKGTYVMKKEDVFFEKMGVRSIAVKNDVSRVSIKYEKSNQKICKAIFSAISQSVINLEMLCHTSFGGNAVISFSLSDSDKNEVVDLIKSNLKKENVQFEIVSEMSNISMIGEGIATHTGIANRISETLFEMGVSYHGLSTSEISISFLINKEDVFKTVNELAYQFGL